MTHCIGAIDTLCYRFDRFKNVYFCGHSPWAVNQCYILDRSHSAKSSHFICTYFLLIVEPYSVREARIHLRRIKDLLSTNFHLNAYSAVDHLSLSFLSAVAGVDVEGECIPCFLMLRQDTCAYSHFSIKIFEVIYQTRETVFH